MRRMIELDGLRGLACLSVLVAHYFGEVAHGWQLSSAVVAPAYQQAAAQLPTGARWISRPRNNPGRQYGCGRAGRNHYASVR